MFERFTDEARQVVVHAQDEARALGHDSIGSAHLLLGILRLPGDGVAPGLLDSFGVTLADAREVLVRLEGRGETLNPGQIPFTDDANRALEESLRQAQALGGRAIGPEHLLLALTLGEGQAARVLLDFDVDAQRVRTELGRRLESAPQESRPATASEAPASERRSGVPILPLLAGWFAFGVAVGIGLLLGWLIWG